jgi:hypothetical protein
MRSVACVESWPSRTRGERSSATQAPTKLTERVAAPCNDAQSASGSHDAVSFVEPAGNVALNCVLGRASASSCPRSQSSENLEGMTTPKSKLLNDSKPGEPAAETTLPDPGGDQLLEPPRRRAIPPPLPPSLRPPAALGPSTTATHELPPTELETPFAPAIRPASPPDASDFSDLGMALEADEVARTSTGFSALFEHASLRDWIRRIEAAQCDAVVTVSGELGHGQLWCVAGNVIDAEWQNTDSELRFTGEDAAQQILTLRGGDVSVAFVPVNRPRLIALSTPQLLSKATRRFDRPSPSTPPSELESTGVRPSSIVPTHRTTLFYRPTTTGIFPHAATQLTASSAHKPPLTTYLAGAVALIALGATAVGIRELALGQNAGGAGAEVHVGTLKAGPALPAAEIEVVPAQAEIWLDSKHVGTGRVSQGAIRDGLVHQLRFIAPGYAPKSIFFRDVPAAGKVLLEPMAAAELSLKKAASRSTTVDPPSTPGPVTTNASNSAAGLTSAQDPVVSDSRRAERGPEARAPEARHPVAPAARPAAAPSHAAANQPAASQPAASKPASPPPPAKPQIQVIEVRTPRVQVID